MFSVFLLYGALGRRSAYSVVRVNALYTDKAGCPQTGDKLGIAGAGEALCDVTKGWLHKMPDTEEVAPYPPKGECHKYVVISSDGDGGKFIKDSLEPCKFDPNTGSACEACKTVETAGVGGTAGYSHCKDDNTVETVAQCPEAAPDAAPEPAPGAASEAAAEAEAEAEPAAPES